MLRPKKAPGSSALDGMIVFLAGLLLLELHLAMAPAASRVRPFGWMAARSKTLQNQNVVLSPPEPDLRNLLLSRPLFDPARRPALPAQDPAPAAMPRLSAIMVTPTERIAVFSPAAGPPVIVNQNSQFGPFTVLAITSDRVTIKGPGGVAVLVSDFGSAGAGANADSGSTLLAGGISLSLKRLTLPDALNWPGQGQPASPSNINSP